MFTPIAKKYSKEPSLRYSTKEVGTGGRLGLHKSGVGRDSFGPVERKSGSFKSGFFRNADFRKEQGKEGVQSQVSSGLFDRNGLSSLQQQEPVPGKYWPDSDLQEQGLKYSSSEAAPSSRNSYLRSTGRNYSTPGGGGLREQKGYGNQLLSLRAELSEKELQLVEIQQQHNKLICRSTDAFKKLEVAIKTKDQVIWQLHQALQTKQDELERHGKLFDEEKQVLLQATQQQKNTEIEQKDTEIALLRAKNTTQLQELQQRDEFISNMKQQLQDEKEKLASNPVPGYIYSKIDSLTGQIQTLESTLQTKETEFESQRQLCNELKSLVWKRECMLGQLQVAEQQLQAALARQTEAYNSLEALKDKLQEEKVQNNKNLAEYKRELDALGSAALNDRHLKEELKAQEVCLQNKEKLIHELQRALHAKDVALNAQSRKFQMQLEENQKLIEDYELLKQEYDALKLENLDELVAVRFYQEAKCELPVDQEILEIPVQDEDFMRVLPKALTPKRLSKMSEPPQPPLPPPPPPSKSPEPIKSTAGGDNELLSIEEEIGRREKEWRQTEAKMRAELCRRIAQLNELEHFRPEPKPDLIATGGRPDSNRSSQFGSKKQHHF